MEKESCPSECSCDMKIVPFVGGTIALMTSLIVLLVACSERAAIPSDIHSPVPPASIVPTSVPTVISSPTPKPTSTATPQGLGITREAAMASLEEAGFDFSVRKPEQTRDGELVVGYSPYEESSSSAVVNLIGDRNDIQQAKLFLYDAGSAPLDSALYLVGFMQSVMPEWEEGSVWLKDTIGRLSSSSRAVEVENRSQGNAQITVTRISSTDVIEVEIRTGTVPQQAQVQKSPTLTATEIVAVATINALLEETAKQEKVEKATHTPTATPIPTPRQIMPSLALTAAAEPTFSDLPAMLVGRCGDPVQQLVRGTACYFDDHNSAFFVNEEDYGCLYKEDQKLVQCELGLWEFVDFCIEKAEDVDWDYKWRFGLVCAGRLASPTPIPDIEVPVDGVEGLGYCESDWFLVDGEGCHINYTELFFWVNSDDEGCLAEGEHYVCLPNELLHVMETDSGTLPLFINRTTSAGRIGWKIQNVDPLE